MPDNKKVIVHIVGNRPQFIKLAVLYRELAKDKLFTQKIIHTGQHFDYTMSDLFFDELNIPQPDFNFNINNLSANLFIAKAADELADYFLQYPSSIAFVYGDTNTTLAAAIAAKRNNILIVHFEAGVRTGDMSMPEEINRLLTDRLADINLCCTEKNYATMQAEGYGTAIPSKIYLTGDLMFDAFNKLPANINPVTKEKKYVACTIHRAANIGNKETLSEIVYALNQVHKTIPVLMPVHPHTKKMLETFGCKPDFQLMAPFGYLDMKAFLSSAEFIITDSGGTCREAYFRGKKSVIVMDKPFWPEIIEADCAISASANSKVILDAVEALQQLTAKFDGAIFGKGNAAGQIRAILSEQIFE